MSNFREIVPEQQQVITSWIRVQLADLEEVDFIWPFTGMAASASEKRVFPRPSSSWGSPILEIVSRRSKLLLLLSLPRDLSFKLGRSCGVKITRDNSKWKCVFQYLQLHDEKKSRNNETETWVAGGKGTAKSTTNGSLENGMCYYSMSCASNLRGKGL